MTKVAPHWPTTPPQPAPKPPLPKPSGAGNTAGEESRRRIQGDYKPRGQS